MASHPALYLALAFGGGIVCQDIGRFPTFLCAIFFLTATGCAFFFFLRDKNSSRKSATHAALLAAVVAAGMLHVNFSATPTPYDVRHRADAEAEVLLLGEVLEMPESRREYWRVPLAVRALHGADSICAQVRGTVLASGKNLSNLAAGDHVILRGRLRLADEARNPGAFDYRAYLNANGIAALFSCSDSTPVRLFTSGGRRPLARAAHAARSWLQTQIAAFASGQSAALINGMLLGETGELHAEVLEDFSRTGLIHILSISGLHVGFIALLLMLATSLLRIPKGRQGAIVLIALWCYAYLTGMRPPIVRATAMASVILSGRIFERETNLANNLCVAALFILLWQPLQLFQIGFQLSFAAVAGLTYLYKPALWGLTRVVRSRRRPLRWALALMAATLAAQLATLPIIALAYGRVPAAALWGNLVVIPLAFIVIASAVLACIFAPLSAFVQQAYGAVADGAATLMLGFTKWLATLPWAYVEGVHFSPLLLAAYLFALATMVAWRKHARAWLVLAVLLLLNLHVWHEAWAAGPRLRITFFDVGQGDAILLDFPQGKRVLIDTGPWFGESSAGERMLVPYLQRQGIRRLHAVIISHPHADHLGGLPALLRAVQIDTVYHCGFRADSELEQQCTALSESLRVPDKALLPNTRLDHFAPAVLSTLCTDAAGIIHTRKRNLNNASLVLKVIFGGVSLLFPGDAEWESENHLLRHAAALDSDLLKLGHHGSRTSSAQKFLQAVSPQWAVISAGRNNKFGHPHAEVLNRCDSLDIALARTDRDGAVIFETEGRSLRRVR